MRRSGPPQVAINFHRVFAALAALAALIFGPATRAETIAVALQNQQVPRSPTGLYFAGFDVFPVLNDAGLIAFKAQLTGDGVTSASDDSIWCGSAAGLEMEVREGAAPPSMPAGVVFQNFGFPSLNAPGNVAFRAQLAGGGISPLNNESIWRRDSAGLHLASQEGSPAPGTPAGVRFAELFLPDFNDSGEVAISAGLTGLGVGPMNDSGVWGGADNVGLLLREGTAAPGTAASVVFQGGIATRLNNSGQVAVLSAIGGPGITAANNEGLWAGAPGALNLVARRGNGAPGTLPGVVFNDLYGFTFNDAGQVAFGGTLAGAGVESGNNEGLWRGNHNSVQLVARKGTAAAGAEAGTQFTGFAIAALNANGQVAFRAVVGGASVTAANDQGIWRGTPTALALIAREGSSAVAAGPGVVYSSFTEEPGLSDGGQVVFQSSLAGVGVDYSNDVGVYLSDGEETVQVAREKQPLSGSKIHALAAPTGQGNQGRPILNDHGQVVYTATLADGRQGIFLYTPEVRWRRGFGGQWNTASNWTLSLKPGTPHKVRIDPASSVTVFGPAGSATVHSLSIAGGVGDVTLDLQQGGTIAATNGVAIQQNGMLTGDGTIQSKVVNFGTVLADNLTISGGLENRGTVTGRGRINAALTNANGLGKVQVTAGQQLRFSGALNEHVNSSRIEVSGGGLVFDGELSNATNGLITGRDALLRFNGGLANSGMMDLSAGISDVFGLIENEPSGKIVLSGGSDAAFHDNLVNNGELRAAEGSIAVYFGNVSGAGLFTGAGTHSFQGIFSPGNSPGIVTVEGGLNLSRSAELELEIGGVEPGLSYDQLHLDGILAAEGKLAVSLLSDFEPAYGQTFSLLSFDQRDGWFSAVELPPLSAGLLWHESLTESDYKISVVPEPTAVALMIAATCLLLYKLRRRRWAA